MSERYKLTLDDVKKLALMARQEGEVDLTLVMATANNEIMAFPAAGRTDAEAYAKLGIAKMIAIAYDVREVGVIARASMIRVKAGEPVPSGIADDDPGRINVLTAAWTDGTAAQCAAWPIGDDGTLGDDPVPDFEKHDLSVPWLRDMIPPRELIRPDIQDKARQKLDEWGVLHGVVRGGDVTWVAQQGGHA